MGVPYGLKVTRSRTKVKSKKKKIYINLKDLTKWNKKMGGRSFVITCSVIGTLYSVAGAVL